MNLIIPESESESDEWIIKLLERDAEDKEKAAASIGIRAFLNSNSKKKHIYPTPALNKRFLRKTVQAINAHNIALIRKETRDANLKLHKLKESTKTQTQMNTYHQNSDIINKSKILSKKQRSITFVREKNESFNEISNEIHKGKQSCTILKTLENQPNNLTLNQYNEKNISSLLQSPLIGPSIPTSLLKNNQNHNISSLDTLALNSHFDPNYDSKLDVVSSSDENDDWSIAIKAAKSHAQWKKLNIQRFTQTRFSNSTMPEVTQDLAFPIYGKRLREWDRGKIVLDNGDTEIKTFT
ncbi:hypothetical protein PCANB_000697 [Pneumocystis canis]|nr:hypothetical protein PCK1_000681 [Pneumocystis canis]KAG5437660.1 hypothetical protein PCANB_000697 [Pneumocystis canis]